MAGPPARRGECSSCHGRRPLRKDGTVGGHQSWREPGDGAALTREAARRGITFSIVRTWPGGRKRERQIKLQGGASRVCSSCTPMKRMYPEGYKGKRGRT